MADRHRRADSDALLRQLAPAIAREAQSVYDEWEQDEHGESGEYGAGGICDDIAEKIVEVLDKAGIEATSHHDESENHTAVYAKLPDGIYYVDIPCRVYETGSFYRYQKRPEVTIEASDVLWDRVFEGHDRWDAIAEGY